MSLTDSVVMSLSKLLATVKDRGAWRAAVLGGAGSGLTWRLDSNRISRHTWDTAESKGPAFRGSTDLCRRPSHPRRTLRKRGRGFQGKGGAAFPQQKESVWIHTDQQTRHHSEPDCITAASASRDFTEKKRRKQQQNTTSF